VHGLKDFRRRFNPLRYYTPEEIAEFFKRDNEERRPSFASSSKRSGCT